MPGIACVKLVLSRKGFDSSAGGVANPQLPDGRLLPLPIPDADSPIRYRDLQDEPSPARLVHALTRGRLRGSSRAHLDPDLDPGTLARKPGWRPLFGQQGAAQGHLQRHAVGAGDLFLFFGWFRAVEPYRRGWRFVPGAPDRHLIHGWFQVAEVCRLAAGEAAPDWARYHPHCFGQRGRNNALYIAARGLQLPGLDARLPGAGLFPGSAQIQRLTAGDNRSDWRLPGDFLPRGRPPLSYHEQPARWAEEGEFCRLQAAFRGQEFVLNLDHYPALFGWLAALFAAAHGAVTNGD